MHQLRLRPPRHAGAVSGMRGRAGESDGGIVKRRLFNLLAVVSLVLCLASLVLWIRDSRHFDYAAISSSSRLFVCTTFPGGLKFSSWPGQGQGRAGFRFRSFRYNLPDASGQWISPPQVSWAMLGFDFKSTPSTPAGIELSVPFWFLTALFLTLPLTLVFRSVRRRRRRGQGQCAHCGYDLRASKDRCPECGAAIPAAMAGEPERSG